MGRREFSSSHTIMHPRARPTPQTGLNRNRDWRETSAVFEPRTRG